MRLMLVGLTALLCQAQPDVLPPDLQLLAKVKNRIAANLRRLPNYTCVQTIERSHRRSTTRKFDPLDTVRLEVALVEGKELFGWPGGDRIAESEISNLVKGTIGNGDFALLAKSIFLTSSATFQYAGDSPLGAKPAIKFDYRVPLLTSGYHLKVPPQEAVVPYHGSFWVEPDTFDLIRLELAVDDIPINLGLAAATNSMEYARVEIGGSQFLLPQSSELSMIETNGAESRNQTRFGACRQFAGESVLTFADIPRSLNPATKPPVKEIELPENLMVELTLETPIDSATAAVGDAIKARLRHNLKVHHEVLIPKDAELTGHIVRLERSNRTYILEIAATAIDFDGGHAGLSGRDNMVWMPFSVRELRLGLNGHGYGRSFTVATSPITIPTDHLKLGEGVRLNLRSRLLQSEQ